ncbi:MAG TPA: S1/P1 nuclease, partial [Legionellaceae bacterium]|nr:S1/P1 nuclease [Legionellaceae bacterium]
MRKYILFFLFLSTSVPGFTWCANGHKVIGQIAYDHLTRSAKRQFAHLNQRLNQTHAHYSLIGATVWMDKLYDPQYIALKPMHYIDIPYSTDGTPLPKPPKMNAVIAVQQAIHTLQDSAAEDLDRA